METVPHIPARSYDPILTDIAEYVVRSVEFDPPAIETARLCLMDSLGCALLALEYPACTKMLGPVVPGAEMEYGARVPGTAWRLEPVQAAFNIGTMIRWLDYNDTWLAAEWGHPSDNLGAIIALADYLDRNPENRWCRGKAWTVRELLAAAIMCYEIQGVLALENSFNRVGLDHVLLVRIASAAVACSMLGGSHSQIADTISLALLDGGALRTYRHAPNTGSRKSWAAGDATSRAVQLALWTMCGEMGYATALSAPHWGFQDVVLRGNSLALGRPLGSYVMENILFKVSFPAEFHAQTAAEAAIRIRPQVLGRFDEIREIRIDTQESAIRIIDKHGPLANPADRDHCLQYIVAVALLNGELTSQSYQSQTAADPRIDLLRNKMVVRENPQYSRDYLDPDLRSISNCLQVFFEDGSQTERLAVEFPLGHRRRRAESLQPLREKFRNSARKRFDSHTVDKMLKLFDSPTILDNMRVSHLADLFAAQEKCGEGIERIQG